MYPPEGREDRGIDLTGRDNALNPAITHAIFVRAPPPLCAFGKADLRHNHDPRGAVSKAQEKVLPLSFIDDRRDDIRKWTAANLGAPEIFKLLHADCDNRLLIRQGKKKVSYDCYISIPV